MRIVLYAVIIFQMGFNLFLDTKYTTWLQRVNVQYKALQQVNEMLLIKYDALKKHCSK